ncbi:MAG TPA: endo alpha-1,4 polygalactosaminidase [Solirubrobacterales bacterium]|nr:endo alpha-1,4 polygalactosaminidase [Solirubrobacterales bacterium]
MRKSLHLGVLGAVLAACAVLLAAPATATARWHPAPTTNAWQWELQGKFELTPGASVYEIDGFEYPAADVQAIHGQGAKAICYLDVGSWEEYRPDKNEFPKSVLGRRYEGFPNERWLDIAHYKKFAPIIERRIAMCARKGFDAVEPDNINGWENKTGFPLTGAEQLRYNRWIARQVHKRGMAVALKNDARQVRQLVGSFDFAVVEECFQYEECDLFKPFVEAGKAVFEAEYELPTSKFCGAAEALDFASIRKGLELFAQPWEPCDPLPGATG